MAIGTPVVRGTAAHAAASVGSVQLTTSSAVPAGDHIVVAFFSNFNRAISISGGGLTWQTDSFQRSDFNTLYIFSAYCPSGLASGTVLTFSWSPDGNGARSIIAASISGLDPTSWKDQNSEWLAAPQAAWDTNTTPARSQAEEISISAAAESAVSATTSTVNAPAAEIAEAAGAGRCLAMNYEQHSSVGTSRHTGTFTTNTG